MFEKLIDVIGANPILPIALPILLLGSYLFTGYTYLEQGANGRDVAYLKGNIELMTRVAQENREDVREIRTLMIQLMEQRCQQQPTNYSPNTIRNAEEAKR